MTCQHSSHDSSDGVLEDLVKFIGLALVSVLKSLASTLAKSMQTVLLHFTQLIKWKKRCMERKDETKKLKDALNSCDETFYPNISTLLNLLGLYQLDLAVVNSPLADGVI